MSAAEHLSILSGRDQTESQPLTTFLSELEDYYQALMSQREQLDRIAVEFRDQAQLWPTQCGRAIQELTAIRTSAQGCREFLNSLTPQETEEMRPCGPICSLYSLDYYSTEAILCITVFRQICQEISMARVRWHIHIRGHMPRLLACYDDTIHMLEALAERLIEPPSQQAQQEGRGSYEQH